MFKLTTDGALVPYSESERALFALLGAGAARALDTKQLADKRYEGEEPFHSLSIVRSTISSLARKIEANKEPFTLEKSERNGPHPVSYWLERKGR
jgi:hypothetical protein